MIFIDHGNEKGKVVEISRELRRLRAREPPHSNKTDILRTTIMGYELGAIQQYTVRVAHKTLHDDMRRGLEENAKLGMADLVTQLRMYCIDNHWNFNDIQAMGLQHLKEQHEIWKMEKWGDKK